MKVEIAWFYRLINPNLLRRLRVQYCNRVATGQGKVGEIQGQGNVRILRKDNGNLEFSKKSGKFEVMDSHFSRADDTMPISGPRI